MYASPKCASLPPDITDATKKRELVSASDVCCSSGLEGSSVLWQRFTNVSMGHDVQSKSFGEGVRTFE